VRKKSLTLQTNTQAQNAPAGKKNHAIKERSFEDPFSNFQFERKG